MILRCDHRRHRDIQRDWPEWGTRNQAGNDRGAWHADSHGDTVSDLDAGKIRQRGGWRRKHFLFVVVFIRKVGIRHQLRGVTSALDFSPSSRILAHLGEVTGMYSSLCQPFIGERHRIWTRGVKVSKAFKIAKAASPESDVFLACFLLDEIFHFILVDASLHIEGRSLGTWGREDGCHSDLFQCSFRFTCFHELHGTPEAFDTLFPVGTAG